jgi:hypothetical protein
MALVLKQDLVHKGLADHRALMLPAGLLLALY